MITTIQFSELLLDAAREVFETMIFMSIEQCQDNQFEPAETDLLGTITFKGRMQGCVGFRCSQDCARAIAANMMGLESANELKLSEICDAVGEVTNMVLGSFKTRVMQDVGNIEVSIPTVISGCNLNTMVLDHQEPVIVPVTIDEHQARLILQYKFNS
jgi:chemotaxis protein CheX